MANHLILEVFEKNLQPGGILRGEILWDLEKNPDSLYLSFGWWTSGRGDRDEYIVGDKELSRPTAIGKEAFSFQIPHKVVPSFSGKLISVEWGLQLSVIGVRVDDLIEPITVSPTMEEIDISQHTYESKGKSVSFRKGRRLSLPNRT
tara:strand:- start:38667 stop:39107 length:441 start_codon:yes stop_codon:yes gene_type:complete